MSETSKIPTSRPRKCSRHDIPGVFHQARSFANPCKSPCSPSRLSGASPIASSRYPSFIFMYAPGSPNTRAVRVLIVLQIQIFRGKWFVRCAYTIMFFSISYSMAVFMEAVVLCRPIAYTWDKSIDGTCGNATQAYEAVGIINLITDLAIIILPMPLLWQLQLPLAKKVALTAIFGIGIVYVSSPSMRAEHD